MKIAYILALLKIPKVGPKTAEFILSNCKSDISSVTELLHGFEASKKYRPSMYIPSLNEIENAYAKALAVLRMCDEQGVRVLTVDDIHYPARLRELPDKPLLLYVKGSVTALNTKYSIAAIGTREPSEFGRRAGYRLAQLFTERGFSIVSGLATGCDKIAHQACLDARGCTVAVLASGVDYIYPRENKALAADILDKGGCLVSEYEPGIKPQPSYFIARDRLQSGLSDAVVVIETAVKGGTMHTVKFSELQHRRLACLSHPAAHRFHDKAQGNNMLIAEKSAFPLGDSRQIDMFINSLIGSRSESLNNASKTSSSHPTNHPANSDLSSRQKTKDNQLHIFKKCT